MSRKLFPVFAFLLIFAFLLTACGGSAEPAAVETVIVTGESPC